jgi:hypothetical protein
LKVEGLKFERAEIWLGWIMEHGCSSSFRSSILRIEGGERNIMRKNGWESGFSNTASGTTTQYKNSTMPRKFHNGIRRNDKGILAGGV